MVLIRESGFDIHYWKTAVVAVHHPRDGVSRGVQSLGPTRRIDSLNKLHECVRLNGPEFRRLERVNNVIVRDLRSVLVIARFRVGDDVRLRRVCKSQVGDVCRFVAVARCLDETRPTRRDSLAARRSESRGKQRNLPTGRVRRRDRGERPARERRNRHHGRTRAERPTRSLHDRALPRFLVAIIRGSILGVGIRPEQRRALARADRSAVRG